MLVAYLSNEAESIQWGDAPTVGDVSPIGVIASIEFYKGELETICIATTEPITHEEGETFNIQLSPDRSIITYGFSMIGRAPTGRLMDYKPTGQGDGMTETPSDWRVDMVDTCTPMETGTYTAIHICHCVRVDMPVAA